ncbi:MAG: dihydroorotate dehydrogenase [Candidatus Brocadiia bacterium]
MANTPQNHVDISVDLCGIKLSNPTILASGILGLSKDLMARVADNGAGAVTIKSVSPEPRKGHNGPTVIAYEAGLLNAVGYSNPGADEAAKEFAKIDELHVPAFASVVATEPEEFAEVAEKLMPCGFAGLILPLSCPHTPGFGVLAGHSTPEATEEITRTVRETTDKPIFVKLSPNVPAIGELVLAALEGGADGISAVNTLGPGMIIDIDTAEPVLDFKVGGVSGPALRPVAVRCVYDAYHAMTKAGKVAPIIGIGGVSSGQHALQMVMAGASAVGIGTGVYERGFEVFGKVAVEIRQKCLRLEVDFLSDLRGAAHA